MSEQDDSRDRSQVRQKKMIADHFEKLSRWDPLESTCRHASLSIL